MLILVLGVALLAGCSEKAEVDAELSTALQAQIDRDVAGYGVTGISAAVVLPNGAVWAGVSGKADKKSGRRLEPGTAFAIGSVTKTFVGALVLELVEDGTLSLDDPIGRWVPEFPKSKGATATLRQLLGHTSGVDEVLDNAAFWKAVTRHAGAWSAQQTLRYVDSPSFAPGRGSAYSNTNYVLLGMAIERAAKAPLAELIRARLLDPLDLDRIAFQSPTHTLQDTAHGYTATRRDAPHRDVSDGTPYVPNKQIAELAWAAGGMAADARSVGMYADALFGGEVLERSSLEQMTDAHDSDDYWDYGLGVMEMPLGSGRQRALGHTGAIDGFLSAMWYLPNEDVTVVVLANQDTAPLDNITDNLLDLVVSHLDE